MTPMGEMPSFDAIRESILIRRADRLESENANLREALENERKFSAATKIRVAELERELEQAKADRARAAMDARNLLLEELAELEARCKRLEEAGNHMLEALYTPEPPRCVCDRSFPCDDCVNYSSARDAKQKWQQAKEAKP